MGNDTQVLRVGGLVCGVASLVLALLVPVAAVVSGVVGLLLTKGGKVEGDKTIARSGAICCLLGIVIAVAVIVRLLHDGYHVAGLPRF